MNACHWNGGSCACGEGSMRGTGSRFRQPRVSRQNPTATGRPQGCPSANRTDADVWGGLKGGDATPRQSANVLHRVGWLTDHNSRKPALGGAAETASQSTVRSSVHWADAVKLRGLSVASLKDGEGGGRRRHLLGDSGDLCRPPFSPYPYPSETGDRRSGAILEPVDYPKRLRAAPKRPLSPVARSDRSWCLLTGPRDTPPNRP